MKKTLTTRLLALLLCMATLATVTPLFAAAEITITQVDITGVTEPVAGQAINCDFSVENVGLTKAAEGDWFNITDDDWMHDGFIFEAGKQYRFLAYVDVLSGYAWPSRLSGNVTATMNGQAAEIAGVDKKEYNSIYYTFTCSEASTVIDKIEITNADVTPYIGGKVENYLYYTLPDNCHYSMETNLWYNEGTGNYLPGAETAFASGNTYTHVWNLVAEEGYIFAENATVTVNESSTLVDTTWTKRSDDGTMFEVWTLPSLATAPTVIDKIEITDVDTVPHVGDKAGDSLGYTLPANCHYTATAHYWYSESNGDFLEDTDVFEADSRYDLYWYFEAESGYEFSEEAAVTINGATTAVDPNYTAMEYGEPAYFVVWTLPEDTPGDPAANVINKIEINGFCSPIVDGKASDYTNLTVPIGAHYHFDAGDRRWYNDTDDTSVLASGVFEAGKSYSLGGWLVADAGYVFAADAEVLLNGGDYPVDEENTGIDGIYADVFYIWGESKEAIVLQTIDQIEINGFCTPIAGGKVGDFLNFTIPEDAHFTFGSTGLHWYDEAADNFIYTDDVAFKNGNLYSVGGNLLADDGYVFAENAKVLFNGSTADVDMDHTYVYGNDSRHFRIWSKVKKAITIQTIDKIEISGVDFEPIPGEKAGDHLAFTLPDDCHYTVSKVRWYYLPIESDGEFCGMNNEDVFETETIYYAEYILLPDEGYVFAKDAAATINGSTERTGEAFLSGDGSFSIFTKQTECVEPTTPTEPTGTEVEPTETEPTGGDKLLGDANDDGNVNMKDVLLIRKFLAGMSVTLNEQNADCNSDGTVNMKDVLMLRKYLAGLITELG